MDRRLWPVIPDLSRLNTHQSLGLRARRDDIFLPSVENNIEHAMKNGQLFICEVDCVFDLEDLAIDLDDMEKATIDFGTLPPPRVSWPILNMHREIFPFIMAKNISFEGITRPIECWAYGYHVGTWIYEQGWIYEKNLLTFNELFITSGIMIGEKPLWLMACDYDIKGFIDFGQIDGFMLKIITDANDNVDTLFKGVSMTMTYVSCTKKQLPLDLPQVHALPDKYSYSKKIEQSQWFALMQNIYWSENL